MVCSFSFGGCYLMMLLGGDGRRRDGSRSSVAAAHAQRDKGVVIDRDRTSCVSRGETGAEEVFPSTQRKAFWIRDTRKRKRNKSKRSRSTDGTVEGDDGTREGRMRMDRQGTLTQGRHGVVFFYFPPTIASAFNPPMA
jgi:hypothetical protein